MKKFSLVVLFSLLTACSDESITSQNQQNVCSPQHIIQLQTIENLEQLIDKELQSHNANNILVIFDFNYTLLYPTAPALYKKNMEKNKLAFTKLLNTLSKEDTNLLLSIKLHSGNQKLVSDKTPNLIKKFQKQGVNFIVCTGSLSKISEKSSADIMENLLKEHGITLNRDYFSTSEIKFHEFKKYLNDWPSYKNGIITANRENKGLVLSSFFRKFSKKPEVVIFVDNNPRKVNDVFKISNDFDGVKFIACEYKEYENVEAPQISEIEFTDFWNKKILEIKHTNQNKHK